MLDLFLHNTSWSTLSIYRSLSVSGRKGCLFHYEVEEVVE